MRRGSEPVLKGKPSQTEGGSVSVQAVVASINALSTAAPTSSGAAATSAGASNSARENFMRQRSKTSVNPSDFWGEQIG